MYHAPAIFNQRRSGVARAAGIAESFAGHFNMVISENPHVWKNVLCLDSLFIYLLLPKDHDSEMTWKPRLEN